MGLGGSKESSSADSTITTSSSSQTPDRKKSISNTGKIATPTSSTSSKRKHEEISNKPNRQSRVSGVSVVGSTPSSSPSTKKVKRESIVVVEQEPVPLPQSTVVVTFSGFKNSSERFSKTLKKELTQSASLLGVTIAGEQATDIDTLTDDVTHVIAPPFARTMKVLQALATGKRIMSTKWITEGKCSLDEEDKYGVQRLDKPLKGKNIFLAESFTTTNDPSSLTYKHCHLLVGYGDGKITDNLDDADFCIVGSALDETEESLNKVQEEKDKIVQDYPYLLAFEWAEFVDLIYPFYLEQALRKMEK